MTMAADRSDQIDLRAVVLHILGDWQMLVVGLTGGLILGLLVLLFSPPTYQAHGLIQIENRGGAFVAPEGMKQILGPDSQGMLPGIESEMEVLQSRMVLGEALRRTNGQIQITRPTQDLWRNLLHSPPTAIGIEVLRFDPPDLWIGQPFTLTLTEMGYELTLPDGQTFAAAHGQALTRYGVILQLGAVSEAAGTQVHLVKQPFEQALADLRQSFSVTQGGRGSALVRLGLRDPDPWRAQAILGAIAQSYVAQNLHHMTAEASNSLRFVEEQIPPAYRHLQEAQEAVNAYQAAQQSVDLGYEMQSLLARVAQIETDLTALDQQEADLKTRYTPQHPTYRGLLDHRQRLHDQLADLRQTGADLPKTQKELMVLNGSLELARQAHSRLVTRAQELRVLRASTVGSVRVIDPAWVAPAPIAPRRPLTLGMAGFLGVLAAMVWIVLRDSLRPRVADQTAVETMGIEVLSLLPLDREMQLRPPQGFALQAQAITAPTSAVIEAVRALRTTLHFLLAGQTRKRVVLTSCHPAAGKSFVAINLAVLAAQGGLRVCLVDGDLRRGELHRYLPRNPGDPGLSDLLREEVVLAETLCAGPVEGLSILPCGPYPPNPSDLLLRPSLSKVLHQLDAQFDLVVIDTPPALAVTDPVIWAREAGCTLAVLRHHQTTLPDTLELRRRFEAAGCKVQGVVLNGYQPKERTKLLPYDRALPLAGAAG